MVLGKFKAILLMISLKKRVLLLIIEETPFFLRTFLTIWGQTGLGMMLKAEPGHLCKSSK
jgi:hypothetical protein